MVGLTVDLGFLWGVLSLEGGSALDAAALAHRADVAGADAVVIPLGGEDGPGFSVADARRVKSILRKPLVVALRGTRQLKEAIALSPAEVLFLSEGGGPVELELETAGSGPLSEATAKVRAAGLLPVLCVVPDEAGVLAAQDAGAGAVELSAALFGAARTDDQALDAHRRIALAAGLILSRVRFQATAVDTWHAILTEAEHAGQVEAVVAVVTREYGANSAFREAARALRE